MRPSVTSLVVPSLRLTVTVLPAYWPASPMSAFAFTPHLPAPLLSSSSAQLTCVCIAVLLSRCLSVTSKHDPALTSCQDADRTKEDSFRPLPQEPSLRPAPVPTRAVPGAAFRSPAAVRAIGHET